MKKSIFLTVLLFSFSFLFSQQVEFTYQAGLALQVKKIVPVPGSSVFIIAAEDGSVVAWDIYTNRILCKIQSQHTELSDLLYCRKENWILVAGDQGVEVFDAGKLLTEQVVEFRFRSINAWITGLSWNEEKGILKAISNHGDLYSFTSLNSLQDQKDPAIFKTGVSGAFAVVDIDDRFLVLGTHKQTAFHSAGNKLLFSISEYNTGMYGYAVDIKTSSIYLPREADLIRLVYKANSFEVQPISLRSKIEEKELVLGVAIVPGSGKVLAGTNGNRIISVMSSGKNPENYFELNEISFTTLLVHNNYLLAGDFFGNVHLLNLNSGDKISQLNEDATPSLNGIYLNEKNLMVSTHFGARGFGLRIWDLSAGSLLQSFNVKGNLAYNVRMNKTGDSILSWHTDNAVYLYHKKGESYVMDTLEKPDIAFMYGSIFMNFEVDKRSPIEKDAKEFQNLLSKPGLFHFPADEFNESELGFVNSLEVQQSCKDGKMPSSYRIPEAYLAASGLTEETTSWDILEKDLFYLKACTSDSLSRFLTRVKDKNLDPRKLEKYFKMIKGIDKVPSCIYITDPEKNNTLFTLFYKEKPLYLDYRGMPQTALFFFKDSLVVWNRNRNYSYTIPNQAGSMDFYYDFNENYVAIADLRKNTISLYRTGDSFQRQATNWIPFGDDDYLIYTKTGYFKTTRRSNRINFFMDKKPLAFNTFDLMYNRPDIVIKEIGVADSSLISAYQKAWLKRTSKSGINVMNTSVGDLPVADFSERHTISYNQTNEQLALKIHAIAGTSDISRLNIWINEVPVFGSSGTGYYLKSGNKRDTIIHVTLSNGENRVEVSAITVNAVESIRKPLTVNHTSAATHSEKLHFFGIGIDRFKQSQYNLQYSAKDIRDLSKKLKEKYGNDITIDTLFNENVTVSNIKALKIKLLKTNENDKVIVSYSGHGMLSKDYDYFLSTYSVNFENPEQNGLPYDELESLLDSIPARKKLMLIDACHSGEVDKEDLMTLNATSDSLIKGIKPVAYKENTKHLGLKNSFELMQSLFVNVGKSTGATIISAAAGTQFALERNDLKNGVFTYSILEAMQHRSSIKVSELKTIVSKRVEELTKGLQKPTFRNETISADWNVW